MAMQCLLLGFIAAARVVSSAKTGSIAAVSWGAPAVDIFGIAPDKSLWHKYDRGTPDGWHPLGGKFENLKGAAYTPPSAVSWGANRVDYFFTNKKNAVEHGFWDGSGWKPDGDSLEDLGGTFSSDGSLAVSSWGEGRLDIVGRGEDDGYWHKAWTGSEWNPGKTDWLDLGGKFVSSPSVVSWAPGRIDIVGIGKDGSILHKYWNGDQWFPNAGWESLGGGPFIGDPLITSWGADRFDVWAVHENGTLHHKYWNGDGKSYVGWESLEGEFKTAPQVVHWDVGKIDIIGKKDTVFVSKAFDGSKWYPSFEGWFDKAGDFASEPAVVNNRGANFVYVLGVGNDNQLKMQIWDGWNWQPAGNKFWDLGDTSKPYEKDSIFHVQEFKA